MIKTTKLETMKIILALARKGYEQEIFDPEVDAGTFGNHRRALDVFEAMVVGMVELEEERPARIEAMAAKTLAERLR